MYRNGSSETNVAYRRYGAKTTSVGRSNSTAVPTLSSASTKLCPSTVTTQIINKPLTIHNTSCTTIPLSNRAASVTRSKVGTSLAGPDSDVCYWPLRQ